MRMITDLRLVQQAVVLNDHGNFARAANALGVAQPTLSRSIAALERALGVPLFNRSHKGVTPTPFGRVLLERGGQLLKDEAGLRREMGLLAGMEEGTLAVGAGPYLADTSVALAIARFASAYPKIRIRCASTNPAEILRDVLAERIDVGVTAVDDLDTDDRLAIEVLPRQRIYFACRPGHPLLKERTRSLKRVLEFPLVTTLLRGAHAALLMDRVGPAASGKGPASGVAPHIQVDSLAMARTIARGSDTLFPGTAAILAEDVAAGNLVRLDIDSPALQTNPGVFYLRGRVLSPAAQAFIGALRTVESEAQARESATDGGANKRRPDGKRRLATQRG